MGSERQTAAIVSMGAVAFNVEGDMSEPFYVNVSLKDSLANGLTVDAVTIKWWMEQEDAARRDIFVEPVSLRQALGQFRAWVLGTCQKASCWTHATFDAPVLANAYATIGEKQPTHFRRQRDIRTLTDLYLLLVSDTLPEVGRVGTHHNAADDAVFQAKYISRMLTGLLEEVRGYRQ
jgi:hypothetical protein